MKEQMQAAAFQIIATVGCAKSNYVEALYKAREGKFEEARTLIKEGDDVYAQAHHLHFDLVQKEASGVDLPFSIIFMHAEDQLLNTETIKLMAEEIIFLREQLNI